MIFTPFHLSLRYFLNILSIIFQFTSENNQNAHIYTENQMQHNNILVSNNCDLVCVIIGSTVTHPEVKLTHPRNDKVPVVMIEVLGRNYYAYQKSSLRTTLNSKQVASVCFMILIRFSCQKLDAWSHLLD